MVEYLQNEGNCPPQMEEMLQSFEDPEERAAFIERFVAEMPREAFVNENPFFNRGIELDNAFLGANHAILPPEESLSDSSTYQLLAKVYQKWEEKEDVPLELLEESKEAIVETWRVNPTFYDPFWCSTDHKLNVHEFNPVDEFCKFFFQDAVAYMTEKPADLSFSEGDDRTLFSFTSLFFWNVAFSMSQLITTIVYR